jgi:hypothetical protein
MVVNNAAGVNELGGPPRWPGVAGHGLTRIRLRRLTAGESDRGMTFAAQIRRLPFSYEGIEFG